MKKCIYLAVCLLLAALPAAGCGGGQENVRSTAGTVKQPQYQWGEISGQTLTVWGRDTDLERSYMVTAFKRYEELTGNTVRVVAFPAEELEEKAAAALKSKAEAPDLILNYGGTNIDAFEPDVNLYDFSNAPWVEDLTTTSISQTIYHGKIIGLPHWEASISGTLYNKTIFKKYGIDPPRNQEEFLEVCEKLLKNGVTPLYLPCGSPTMLLYQFPLDTLVEDEDILDGINQNVMGYANLPEMKTVADWYRNMAQCGYLGENYMLNDWDGMSEALSSGKYAMMLCWDTWLYTDYKGDPAEFGLMPAYMGIPGNGTFEGPNLSLLLVNRNSAKVDTAVDLVTFMADPYNYNVAFEGIYTAPVFKKQLASISTPQYVEATSWIEQNYRDSIAWLRIKGFSQSDASCFLDYMQGREGYTAEQCLKDMDALRQQRTARSR